jgi:regulator of sigma E protease
MLTLVAFVFVLGPLILLHEAGHFVAAKLTGVRVEEFGFGWPPRLFKLWQSASQLTIGSTPIITPRNFKLPGNLEVGQHVDAITQRRENDIYVLQELRVLNRETDDLTRKRELVDQGVHLRGELTAVDPGTVYSLNVLPLGGFCRMTGEEDPSDPRSLAAQPKRERLAVLMGGAVMNLLVAILLFSASFLTNHPESSKMRVLVQEVLPDTPASEAKLQAGDIILEANGIAIERSSDLVDYTKAHPGEQIELTLQRGEKTLKQKVWVAEPEGKMGIGIVNHPYDYVMRRSSMTEALQMGLEQFGFSIEQMLQLPALLIRGQISAEEARPLGPVGISQLASDAIEQSNRENSWFTIIYFAGVISMALGVTNLLPIPALDGGRILFVLIEALRGRRIDPAKEGVVHLIGMALLLGFMLIVTIQELINGVPSPFQ